MKKKRARSFLGIHFDFHAMPGQTVCRPFRPDLTARMLDAVRPDFVQCDTKGHPGLSSYPTDVGNRADEILHDPLRMWRDLTEERDIALYGHHSGLYDRKAAELHPDWAVVDENGNVSQEFLSPFSPYAEELLIPQLKELCDVYRLDGAWVDGECWGLYLDYGPYAAAAYEKETGKKTLPRRGEEGYAGYREFCREGFRRYVAKYVTALKEHNPDFEVTSNWMYSAYMPEPPSAHVDFLSGDYATSDSMESARFQGRCLAARGMTWDLMAWGQNAVPCSWQTRNRTEKEPVQYCQEASEVLALGGAFQFFNIMYGGGGILQEWMIPTWEKTAAFCRERQEICFGAKLIPQVGILYPEAKSDEKRNVRQADTEKPQRHADGTRQGGIARTDLAGFFGKRFDVFLIWLNLGGIAADIVFRFLLILGKGLPDDRTAVDKDRLKCVQECLAQGILQFRRDPVGKQSVDERCVPQHLFFKKIAFFFFEPAQGKFGGGFLFQCLIPLYFWNNTVIYAQAVTGCTRKPSPGRRCHRR